MLFYAVGIGIALSLLEISRRIFLYFGLTDKPAGRKKHLYATPYNGGLCLALILLTMLFSFHLGFFIGTLIIASCLIFSISFSDDLKPKSSMHRLFFQLVCAVGFVFITMHYADSVVGRQFNVLQLTLFSLFWAVLISSVTNAFNMSDGMDGLCGSLAALSFSSFAVLGALSYMPNLFSISFGVALFLVLFVSFNLSSRRKIFLGDGGSTTLGFMLGGLVFLASVVGGLIPFGVSIWFIGCPLMGMARVVLIRLSQRRSPFGADRNHFHHVMIDEAFSTKRALISISFCQLVFCLIGFGMYELKLHSLLSIRLFLATFAVFFVLSHPKIFPRFFVLLTGLKNEET